MGVTFVIGRAGTGKTQYCLEQIAAMLRAEPLGPPVYWIVPRQATFSHERMLLAEVGPFTRARIVSFDLLAVEVLGSTGGAAAAQITARGRQMILGLLLRQHQNDLSFFKSSARRVGLSAELDRTFAEVERSGKTLDDLVGTLQTALEADPTDADTAALLHKTRDLATIYAAYTKFLGPDRLDPHRRLQHVLSTMSACPNFRNSAVFVDGFMRFNRDERQMIVGLAQACRQVTVTQLMDPASRTIGDLHHLPDEMGLFYKIERSYRQLALALQESAVPIEKPIKLTTFWQSHSRPLMTIESEAFKPDSRAKTPADDAIERIEAPDRVAEVDAVARRIRALQMSGHRYRDIQVLVRSLPQYQPVIAASFREHGITYFVDARRSAAHHPLLQWVRSILSIARKDWPRDDVMALLKTGLCGVSLDDADDIENYVLLHGVEHSAWEDDKPWGFQRVNHGDDEYDYEAIEPSHIDALRVELVRKLKPFLTAVRRTTKRSTGFQPVASDSPGEVIDRSAEPDHGPEARATSGKLTFREICSELFKLFEQFKVRHALADWVKKLKDKGELEAAAEHEQTWANLVELFDEMVDLLGPHEVSLDDFVQTLEAGLESFDFALAPPTLDQVTVGEIERSRTVHTRVSFVLGLSEGLFPMAIGEANVLSDTDRSLLRRRSIELDDDTSRLLLDERLLGYLGFTCGSEKLILTRPQSVGGKPVNASPFWLRFDQLIDGIADHTVCTPCFAHDQPDCIATPRQFVTGLMRWARRQYDPTQPLDPTWAALYQSMADCAACEDPISRMRRLAWRALSYANQSSLTAATAERLFPSPLNASVAQIETFAACPFKHFLRYGLDLKTREVRDFTRGDIGQAYHQILDEIVTDLLNRKKHWLDLDPAEIQDKVRDIAAGVARQMRDEIMLSTARNRYLLKRIERTLAEVIAAQKSLAQRQAFRPKATGLVFGSKPNAKLKALVIPTKTTGKEIHLHGKIDRVDWVEGKTHRNVIDYRSGGAELRLQEVYYGLALQLLTFMLVLRENGGNKVQTIGAFYYSVSRAMQTVKHPDDAAEPGSDAFLLRVKPRGIFDDAYLSHFDNQVQASESSLAVQAQLTKDGNIGWRDRSDAMSREQIDKLLDHVKDTIASLGEKLMGGTVCITPYRLGDTTPCPNCEYRGICRFEPSVNKYLQLPCMKRGDVLTKVCPESEDADA